MTGLALNKLKPLTIQAQALPAGTCLLSKGRLIEFSVMIFP